MGVTPRCAVGYCHVSHVQNELIWTWLSMFLLIKSRIYEGQALTILAKAEATDTDLEIFMILDNHLKKLEKEAVSS